MNALKLQRRLDALNISPLPLETGPLVLKTKNTDSLSIWRPKGVLVSTIREHNSGSVKVCVSEDQEFFATGASDGLRVFQTQGLTDRVVVRSDSSHRTENAIVDLTCLTNSHTVACAASNVIDLVRVDEGFRKKCIDRVHIDQNDSVTSLFHNITYSRSMLGYTTQNVGVEGFDLRSRESPYTLPVPPEFGWSTSSYVDHLFASLIAQPISNTIDLQHNRSPTQQSPHTQVLQGRNLRRRRNI